MKKLLLIVAFTIVGKFSFTQESVKKDELYIQTHAKTAVKEMILYKIPASITIAQGILETGNGQSTLAQVGNNHFGIKCKGEWTGDRMYHDDDLKGECFRKYTSAEESYRDHSLFLAERPYYKKLFTLDIKDYKGWAFGLKKAGYATNPKYAYSLISIIERYNLNRFDNINEEQTDLVLAELFPNSYTPALPASEKNETVQLATNTNQKKEVNKQLISSTLTNKKTLKTKTNNFEFPSRRVRIHPNGKIKYIVWKEGDRLEDVAKAYHVNLQNLKSYNDLAFKEEISINQKIYLEPKKSKGISKIYITKNGERMYDIAQNNAISLIELYKRNTMLPGQEPEKGDKIFLKGRKS
ncbi:LysM peptidoglycan-binding domain-containing protein [Apibacter muscae]|uniref:glucosaminidase domain-containing protein n=1 Tax=Apibacter muscae TaxID=2509004 RepID=UPI0011AC10F4|nr:glucosaminidase domain-containing protein [Apibacter muscae]TWP31383.1 LysM peptidoglycan-binding domain-containing protein [Apibacter muscae]